MQNFRRAAYLLNLLLLAALAANAAWKPAPAPRFSGVPAAAVPSEEAGLVSEGETALEPEVQKALSSSATVARTYRSASGELIDFLMIGGTDREALHDPRSCLIGADWRILNDHLEEIPGTGVMARSCRIERPGEAYDVLYFYVVGSRTVHEATQIRMQMLASALIGRRGVPTHFLRFLQPAQADHGTMQRFAARMWTSLQPRLIQAGS